MSDLKNQIAVVTGASSGIGKACCYALAKAGATVCLFGRNINALKKIESEIKKYSPLSKALKVDLFNDDEISEAVNLIKNEYGTVHMLVHSAGIYLVGKIKEAPVQAFDDQYKINVRAPYLLTQQLLSLIDKSLGQIVFINSTAAMTAKSDLSQYCATKSALKALADSLRIEINPEGIRVLSIYPGRTATPMQESVCKHEGVAYKAETMIQPEQVAKLLVYTLEMSRDAEITDITVRPMNAA
jgi:NADP-dependent 3-hydroxy acid dehydrogenase YdfG